MNEPTKCKCGSTQFTRRIPTYGIWEETIEIQDTGKIESIEGFTDDLKNGSQPKTMQCVNCGKRMPNPDYKQLEP